MKTWEHPRSKNQKRTIERLSLSLLLLSFYVAVVRLLAAAGGCGTTAISLCTNWASTKTDLLEHQASGVTLEAFRLQYVV
jgi:hypothetical protein